MPSATYSPEDNKLRLYVGRVPRDDYERLRKAGFVSTPKQDCDFVATWSPSREDLAREFIDDEDDIGDEDYSPLERSADRAERFDGYRDKRADEAGGAADQFAAGPAAFGHQNRARAERQAARHDRRRTFAVSQWSKAEYWHERTRGVIAHALHRSCAKVRRGRILTLEAEQRKNEESRTAYALRYDGWKCVLDTADKGDSQAAFRIAYALANRSYSGEYVHPRNPARKTSLLSLLVDTADPITPAEAAALWLDGARTPGDPANSSERWAAHYELRLTYERAMLEQEGGSAAEADMEPGGWIGNRQIHAINRSPVTKRVVSVKLMMPSGWHEDGPPALRSVNIERLPEGAYRAPTDEERAAFAVLTKERKAKEKAARPKEPALINPTDEDAERLQSLWNERAKDRPPAPVVRMTQAQYSAVSKGSYAKAETRTLHAGGWLARRASNMWSSEGAAYEKKIGAAQCKIRMCGYSPTQVIIITDKPQKALPIDWPTEVQEVRIA